MTLPDGFKRLSSDQLDELGLNASFVVDEFSPFADRNTIFRINNGFVIDQNYGQVYHEMKLSPVAIYGRTADIPSYSGDELANRGFLRVPFRRIPRRLIRNRAELESIIGSIRSADSSLKLLFRGQTREYLISRSPETTKWLYGEDSVLEPSIASSASRRRPSLDDVLAEWCALIKLFILTHRIELSSYDWFSTDANFPFFALALAQHYGLPTAGLDVTDNIDVALFFAQMKYDKIPNGYNAKYSMMTDREHLSVIYILSPHEQQQFEYERFKLNGFPSGRPDVQSARFMHIGWGLASNACANRVFLALYLDPNGDFGELPSPHELFPPAETDLFCGFLQRFYDAPLPATLRTVLRDGFYSLDAS